MAPNGTNESELMEPLQELPKLIAPQADNWRFQVSYVTVAFFTYSHISAVYGLYLCLTSAHWATIVFDFILLEAGLLGVMAGAHRLWSHKSYKATLPLQIILIIFQSLTGQYTAYNWAKDHRLHHRHSDTDADPHNATRGLFFSHVGWLLVHKHPEVKRRGNSIDISDLKSNPVLAFQKKYGLPMIILIASVLPTLIPMYFWDETLNTAYHVNMLRYILSLNIVFLVNSAAHAFGNRPYDKEVRATQNMSVNLATFGEGLHNYHHVFPWDSRGAELITWCNLTSAFLECCAWIGWAYDLKTVENGVVVERAKRCGDGTYESNLPSMVSKDE